ncbi:DNA alkylation repair protein [Tenacibaculum sp. TC6]|uniref:DNA alkylation repair protein n=1 Tax=Tenacibaculum sp. TC6 TaxID=3423223 RepID=UPI003D367191
MVNQDILNRKGARKVTDIPTKVLDLLNLGKIETVNLTEWLAINHSQLIEHSFLDLGISNTITSIVVDEIQKQKKPSTMNSIKIVGETLCKQFKNSPQFPIVFENLKNHPSDSIRGYVPYLISLNDELKIEEKLDQAKPLVADHHFGVREVVWMALRPDIDKNLLQSIKILTLWSKNKDGNIRRFASESIRPRGVWCKHIEVLKENPELALPILDNLKSDSSKYVQDSVGNWLNDASKTKPEFVIYLCEKWLKESPTKETERIVKRARRTIEK